MADERKMAVRRRASLAVPPPAMTTKELFGVLRRHMLLIILLTIIGLAAGGGSCYLLRTALPKYTARAYIEVLPPVQTDPMVMTTPTVQKDIRYGHRLSVASVIKRQGTLEALLRRQVVIDTKWFKRVDGLPWQIKYLNKYLGVTAHRDADYIEVSFTCRDAQEAADIANEMVGMFISSEVEKAQAEVGVKLEDLNARRTRVEEDLRTAERALDEVTTAHQIFDLRIPTGSAERNVITMKLQQLELEKTELDLVTRQLKADLEVLEKRKVGVIDVVTQNAIENDAVMLTLKRQIHFTEAQLAGLRTKFGPNHREVRQTQELRDELQLRWEARADEIGNRTRQANYENANDRLVVYQQRGAELATLLQDATAEQKKLDIARIQYAQRLTIRDERIAMLDAIKESIEKMNIRFGDPDTPKVRPLSNAIKPIEQDFSRDWLLWFPLGAILGLLLSVGIAFLVELANDIVRTPRDVSKYLHIPLLGVIPDAAEDRDVRGVDLTRVVSQAPYSLTSESYRQCKANLTLSGTGESLKTILITSGAAGDGKTCVAANLASAYVAADKKVLLIDANFRQPTLNKIFPPSGSGAGFGLSSLLIGQCGTNEAIRSSGIDGLDIIDAGGLLPPNPAELLGSALMVETLAELRNSYDFIIIDSPPVLLISDPKVLAKSVGTTIVVLNANVTHRGAALRTIRELEEVNANVAGCVLMAAPSLKGGYFQEQYKSYRRYQEKLQAAGIV
jgi:succinoglycan biosynthesis transport protein ExoP